VNDIRKAHFNAAENLERVYYLGRLIAFEELDVGVIFLRRIRFEQIERRGVIFEVERHLVERIVFFFFPACFSGVAALLFRCRIRAANLFRFFGFYGVGFPRRDFFASAVVLEVDFFRVGQHVVADLAV